MSVGNLRLYNQLARPFTLLPPLLGIISGAICAFGSAHNPDPNREWTSSVIWTIVLGSLCASFLNVASNAINQIYDLEIDRVNKPNRPLVTGELSMEDAWGFTFFTYIVAIVPTWLVVAYPFETWGEKLRAPVAVPRDLLHLPGGPDLHLGLLGALAGAHQGPRHAGEFHHRDSPRLPAQGRRLGDGGARRPTGSPGSSAAIFLLFLIGASSTKDFADIEGDRAGGCKTLPILHGPKKAAWIIAPFFVFPWLLLPVGAYLPDPQNPGHAILTGNATALTVLGVVLTLWGAYTVWLLLRDPDALTRTENHPSWKHMYMMMMAAQVGFAVAYLI